MGKLVAGIAHEMNTPIGTINSNADTLKRSLEVVEKTIHDPETPASIRESKRLTQVLTLLEDIARINKLACERIVSIVGSLRNFARLDEAELQVVDLHLGLDSTLTLVHHELKNRITVIKEYGEIPPVRCHPNQINQVFMNLLVNAAQSIAEKGQITIKTFAEGDIVSVQISDSGSGIPPENLSKIFDPGFTTKGVGVGTGLGLSICFKIAQGHNGGIDVESVLGEGSTFTLRLPVSGPAGIRVGERGMSEQTKAPVIAVVDDEEMVLTSLRSFLLLETEYEVETFQSPKGRAGRVWRRAPLDLVISDYLMPDMNGIEFLLEVKKLHPFATRILLTGYADKENAIKAINEVGLYQYVEKPWDNDDLKIIIQNGLEPAAS